MWRSIFGKSTDGVSIPVTNRKFQLQQATLKCKSFTRKPENLTVHKKNFHSAASHRSMCYSSALISLAELKKKSLQRP